MLQQKFLRLSLLLLAIPSSLGRLYSNIDELPTTSFDFIVVGGGTAGPVVANRLSENPKYEVLLLEAGPSHEGVLIAQVPGLMLDMITSGRYGWNYSTTPQIGMNQRVINYSRGFILGGCSAHNSMFYTRGSSDDWDRWAQVTRDQSWSWKNIFRFILKTEHWTAAADRHNQTGQHDPSVHGHHGMVNVSTTNFPTQIDSRVLQTSEELLDFPFLLDMNAGRPLGLGWSQGSAGHGIRSSAATSYLAPQYLSRPNLHVLVNTRVARILPVTNVSREFRTVEIGGNNKTAPRRITARKEVILSAGAVNSPYILFHSGIGNATELRNLGIKPLHDLPGVGQNLTDHPYFPAVWAVNSTKPPINATAALEEWNNSHTGPFSMSPTAPNHIAFLRLQNDSSIFRTNSDPAAGLNTPHMEFTPLDNGGLRQTANGTFVSMGITFLTPTSRGSVVIIDSNPLSPPLINPNLLATEFDVFVSRESMKATQRFFSAPAWQDYIVAPFSPPANATSGDALDQHIRTNAIPSGHISGTCAMSAKGATHGVVDPDLRVKGIKGLRIVDASIMPFIPAAHTQAPVYIIAEKAADMIKSAWHH